MKKKLLEFAGIPMAGANSFDLPTSRKVGKFSITGMSIVNGAQTTGALGSLRHSSSE